MSDDQERVEALVRCVGELKAALKGLVDGLDVALPKLNAFVVLQAVRTGDMNIYDGPSLVTELATAKELLRRLG
jgi:hypothetical protein